MTTFSFYKYQGTGNDFMMIDNRHHKIKLSQHQIEKLCHRRFGIGADGLILLEEENRIFKMVYYNSDGRESSMCGNGGRCFAAFAYHLGLAKINQSFSFNAIDGMHDVIIKKVSHNEAYVHLKMIDVTQIAPYQSGFVLNTGSPHYVEITDGTILKQKSIVVDAQTIRCNEDYKKDGINVNFITLNNDQIQMRTFERGVEDETLSCGTGVTAAALVANLHNQLTQYKISTPGGNLEVSFEKYGNTFFNIWLSGPAALVFSGQITPDLFA